MVADPIAPRLNLGLIAEFGLMLIPDHLRYFLCLHTREPMDRARLETKIKRFPRFPISECATIVCADMTNEEFVMAVAGDLPTGLVSILALNGAELTGIAGTRNMWGELRAQTVFLEPEKDSYPGTQAPLANQDQPVDRQD